MFDVQQFEEMIGKTNPQKIIVCTADNLHADYIRRAHAAGCDVIVEKPIATTDEQCRKIMESCKATNRNVQVSFNCRFIPWALMIKKLIAQGTIGEIINAFVEWRLDARKGVTYFARWHAEKEKSGGLMVHKASHYLDLVNWWLDDVPVVVYGMGRRAFFGADNAHKHGLKPNEGCYLDDNSTDDPFRPKPVTLEMFREKYADASQYDGYRADRSVWRKNGMDIEDSMNVLVAYNSGKMLNFTLNAFLPGGGRTIILNGTKGRLEFHAEPGGKVIPQGKYALPPRPENTASAQWRTRCVIHPLFDEAYEVEIPTAEGGHDGGDPLLAEQLFGNNPQNDVWGQLAGPGEGIAASLIGIAANESFATGLPVNLVGKYPPLKDAKKLSDIR